MAGCNQCIYHCTKNIERWNSRHQLVNVNITVAVWCRCLLVAESFAESPTEDGKRPSERPLAEPHYTLLKSNSIARLGCGAGAYLRVRRNLSAPTSDLGPNALFSRERV